jgi:glycosyltransferase involved in cell wall biosynthesis
VNNTRIVYVTTVDLTVRFLLLDQMRHLQQAGYQVSAVCAPGPWTEEIRAAGIAVRHVDLRRGISPVADLAALVDLVRHFRAVRPHLVHTHTPKANLLGRLAARLAGVPVVVATEHGIFYGAGRLSRGFWMGVTRFGAALSDTVFVMNQDDLRTARSGEVGSPEKYALLTGGLGVDLQRFVPPSSQSRLAARAAIGLPPEAPIVGMVGFPRMDESKGHSEFLAAAGRVQSSLPSTRFLVAGTDQRRGEEIARSLSPELSAAVTFAGVRTDMPAVYAAMDVLCLPSRREGLPVVLMEAAAMGLPCVASDIRGCRDVIAQGETGLLAPPGDVEALAGAISRILTDRDLAASMSAAARRRAEALFDRQRMWAQMDAEYRRLLSARGIPCP